MLRLKGCWMLSLLFTERIHQAQAAAAKARKALQQKPKPPSKVVSDVLRARGWVVGGWRQLGLPFAQCIRSHRGRTCLGGPSLNLHVDFSSSSVYRSPIARRVQWRASAVALLSKARWASVTPACHPPQSHLWPPPPQLCLPLPSPLHLCLQSTKVAQLLSRSQLNLAQGKLFYFFCSFFLPTSFLYACTKLFFVSPDFPHSVLLVSSPTMPQLGTMLSPASSQTPPNSQVAARVVSHSGSSGLPQVRVVAQPSLPAVTQQSAAPAQTLPPMSAGPQIRVPATASQTKVVPQVTRDRGPRGGLICPAGSLGKDRGALHCCSWWCLSQPLI